MIQALCPVRALSTPAENIFILRFACREVSASVRAGQFVNIKVDDGVEPLLRRPFSVYRAEGDDVEIVFNVIGKGTAALSRKRPGDWVDVLGPLGVPFTLDDDRFQTALLLGGGLGVAPLPIATQAIVRNGKQVVTVLGARTSRQLVEQHLLNLHIATDDGSKGFHGNVVGLVKQLFSTTEIPQPKIFGCGPTAMLRALRTFAIAQDIPCEVSLEGPMGCGFGICQGCPVELVGDERKYGLMCKDGPTFDVRRINI
jgi:dihydroorotate dehydrogenase electron transfer subunit